jgi:hypothetical protein
MPIPSLTGVHFLISYGCSAECDHCFIWGTPRRDSGMTVELVDRFLDDIMSLGTVTSVCAEGGESFTRYPVLLRLMRRGAELGLGVSALTNAYWATSREETQRRIAELMAAGMSSLGISTDQWHRMHVPLERVELLLEVCEKAGLQASRMETAIEGVLFRGRAAERLAPGRPKKPAEELTRCPHEQLAAPARMHLDCYGRLHLCQGLAIGGRGPADAVRGDHPASHPIVRLLLDGGPYALARFAAEHGFEIEPGYVDACNLCYRAREFLRSRYPDLLGPDEMYGAA